MPVKTPPIVISLVGNPADQGRVHLRDFNVVARSLNHCLHECERCLTGTRALIEYEVTGLHSGSAMLEVQPIRDGSITVADEVTTLFFQAVELLEQGDSGRDSRLMLLDDAAWESMRCLYTPARRSNARVEVCGIELTSEFIASIDRQLAMSHSELGSLSGTVEIVDIHNRSQFSIFPPISNVGVPCHFTEEMFDSVMAAMKRHVTVHGLLHYARDGALPKRIDVEEIEVHPDDSELPTLHDLRGVLALSVDSVDAVRALRDEY